MLRSAAVSRFYSGLPRWYDLLACVSAFLLCRSALGPFLEKMRAICVCAFLAETFSMRKSTWDKKACKETGKNEAGQQEKVAKHRPSVV